jgi:hypothetical protein
MDFNISWTKEPFVHNKGVIESDPELFEGVALPDPLQAKGSMTYLEMIDTIERAWDLSHPEISFGPFSDGNVYQPDMGYVIYALVERITKQNNTKPRVQYIVDHPDYPNKKLGIFSQSFINTVKFTAVHSNPRIAEEMIESFEDFMFEATAILKEQGLEEIIYGKRVADEHKTRYGEDLAARSIVYLANTQKIVLVDMEKLESIYLTISAPRINLIDDYELATPVTCAPIDFQVEIYDTHATPTTSL